MAAAKLTVKLEGFEELLDNIEKAGGTIDDAADRAIASGCGAMKGCLLSACNSANVPADVSSAVRVDIEKVGNMYRGKVGWELGEYDPKNLSKGYEAVFLNYGTPQRQTHTGANRGAIQPRGFIAQAKKASKKPVAVAQKKALERILEGLT